MIVYNRPTNVGTTGQSQRTLLIFRQDGQIEAKMNGWRTRSGGSASADVTEVNGDEYQGSFVIGGTNVSREDLTATTFFDQAQLVEAVDYLESRIGYMCEFIEHPTQQGQPVPGKAFRWKGKLKSVKRPDAEDRKSTNANEVEITMAVQA